MNDAGVSGPRSVGIWFVLAKGANVQVTEVMRRLASTRIGLEMLTDQTSACLVRAMCDGNYAHAHVVAAALLRVADVLLVWEGAGGGTDVGHHGPGAVRVELLVSCFSCVVDALRQNEGIMFDDAWNEALGALDACLLVASSDVSTSLGGSMLRGVARTGRLGQLRAYLDEVARFDAVKGDADRMGVVFRLRTRLLLVDVHCSGTMDGATARCDESSLGSHHADDADDADDVDDAGDSGDDLGSQITRRLPSIHDVEALVDDVLFWDMGVSPKAARTAGGGETGGDQSFRHCEYLAYVAWIACTTLFHPNLPVFNPNPVSYSKLLCQALECRESTDHACFPLVAWVLASKVVDPAEQASILSGNTDEFGRRKISFEVIRGLGASARYAWVASQMLLVSNKLAVDDASRRGIVVGQVQEATLRTIRSLLFPCALFCPYTTLHNAFRLSTANRNDAWLLIAVCDVFPDLANLPALESAGVDMPTDVSEHLRMGGELARMIVDRILTGAPNHVMGASARPGLDGHEDNDSFLFAARSLFESRGGYVFSGHTTTPGTRDCSERHRSKPLWECLPSMLRAPPCRLELASDFVLDMVSTSSLEMDQLGSKELISACISLLEFDARYRRHNQDPTAFSKRSLDNAQKIVELIVEATLATATTDELYSMLSEIESSAVAPWARLYFGFDFSEYEARYILHTNPKPSLGLTTCFKSVTNIKLHQTLELAALGSIQRAELQDLATGYTSMDHFLDDLQASVRCLFTVCTSSEIFHLMNGLEIFCSTLFVRETSWAMRTNECDVPHGARALHIPAPRTVSACSTAMVVELCLKSATRDLESIMIPDICQYCISSATTARAPPPTNQPLTARLFTELIKYYAGRINSTLDPADTSDHTMTALEAALSVLYNRELAPIIHTAFPDPTATPELIIALLQST